MWKVVKLYLQNFAHIKSGLEKTEVEIDLGVNDNIINILIGKMGSGKSTILGHMQPFATFGSLDIRNQDTVVIPGENGTKIIDYRHGDDIIHIEHIYTWNERSQNHTTKSYISRNGEELNTNGNSGSFKDVVKNEMGIEQNFLRILRLGPNVANLISMKSTERKTFVISLLHNTEIYSMLYKKMSDDLRSMNTSLTVLSNKLLSLSANKVDELTSECASLENKLAGLTSDIDAIKHRRVEIQVTINQLLANNSIEAASHLLETKYKKLADITFSLDDLNRSLLAIANVSSIEEISKQSGILEERKRTLEETQFTLNQLIEETEREYHKLLDRKMTKASETHISTLKEEYARINEQIASYKNKVRNFQCSYSYEYLSMLIDSLASIDMLVDEIRSHPRETVVQLYRSDHSVMTFVEKKINMLQGKKYNLQKEINNIQFTKEYTSPEYLYRPPFCPTPDCPYFKSHPFTLASKVKREGGANEELRRIEGLVKQTEAEQYMYEAYPSIYQRIQQLKKGWKRVTPTLETLGVLREPDLFKVVTDITARQWYDYNKIVDIMESCKIRDALNNLTGRLSDITHELNELSDSDAYNVDELIATNREQYQKYMDSLISATDSIAETRKTIIEVSDMYDAYNRREELQRKLNLSIIERDQCQTEIEDLDRNIREAESINSIRSKMDLDEIELSANAQSVRNRIESLRVQLRYIDDTRDEFERTSHTRNALKNIIRAVSPKEGIPLILMKIFLDSCKDIINDLISDVFADSLEILDFDITDDGFRIPYAINGHYIDDIEMASQGQQAIISIALSFALVRQNIFDYNIMLLDEIDGPLYQRDREKFVSILFKQIKAIGACQVFLITHDNSFDNTPANIIMTTDENIERIKMHHQIKLCS